jgi:hypothetical protein
MSRSGFGSVVSNLVYQEARKKTDAKQFTETLAVVKSRAHLIGDAKKLQELGAQITINGRDRKEPGLEGHGKGVCRRTQSISGRSMLTHNAEATVDAQGVPLMNAKKFAEALSIYETGLQYLPGNSFLEGRRKMCQARLEKK